MPGYGIEPAEGGAGLLPWPWAESRLVEPHGYWLTTASPTGHPHAMPVWGVWHRQSFVFSTGGQTVKARHLAANPRCVVCAGDPSMPVVVEGEATRLTDPDRVAEACAAYAAKYDAPPPDPAENPLFAVRPSVVFGFIEEGEAFTTTATRWVFDGEAGG
jgi:hypothetical protein